MSPPTTATPAGQVLPVGAQPEGVVADAISHLVAVGVRGPNQLVLADDRTGVITHRVPLPGHLRHLQLVGPSGPVLVPDENSDRLLFVALPSGTVLSQVHTGVSPHDATETGDGLVFAANEGGASVAVIRNDAVVHTFTDVTQPAGSAGLGRLVGVVDVRQNNLHVYDTTTLKPVTQLPAGNGPTHVVADKRGQLAVIDTRGNAVLFYQLSPQPRQLGRFPLPGTPYGVAYDAQRDRLWVTLTASNQVVGIDLGTPIPRISYRLPTVRQPNTVAVDPSTGRVFVTGTRDGVLELIDPGPPPGTG